MLPARGGHDADGGLAYAKDKDTGTDAGAGRFCRRFSGSATDCAAALAGNAASTVAQPQSIAAQPQSNANAQAVPVASTANPPEVANPQLRPVTGQLEKKLDSKNAKPGDPVIVKTTENADIANGVVIPKGSRIVGHVATVQPHSKDHENAQLTLQFDQAQLKGGQTLPIETVLENVAPAAVTVHPTDTLNAQSAPMASAGRIGRLSGRDGFGFAYGRASGRRRGIGSFIWCGRACDDRRDG